VVVLCQIGPGELPEHRGLPGIEPDAGHLGPRRQFLEGDHLPRGGRPDLEKDLDEVAAVADGREVEGGPWLSGRFVG